MDSHTSPNPAASPSPEPSHTFQVDLRGLVDLLSHHLYSSPRVYLRELLQNAVDAITARRAADPGAPARVTLYADGGELRVEDSGVGLTEADVHDLLATIGRSSKRAEGLQEARSDFLGQFGIGLLACFVVAERIRVVSRSARTPGAPPVEWTARDDGSYTVRTLPDAARPEPGTTVHLRARAGAAEWVEAGRVRLLAREFGSLLPYDVRVGDEPVTELPAPWDRPYPSPATRRAALARHCHELFGFTPLDSIDLDVPLAGVRGVAYVLPSAVSPAQRAGHRVHLKGMLLTERAEQVLPEWAFFVRCVLDTDSLRPTASRESLYEDETLAAVRDALGERVRAWLTGLAANDPERLAAFLAVHHLGVKSLARLGGFLLAQGRWAEAAEVLESALPDMTAETHGDGAVVQTLWWLGDCLTELGEHRAAAERQLAAADLARHWPEQHDHATLAHLAATSLDQAGLAQEAERAFVRAGDLWRSLGDVHGLVRAVRSRAWLALRSGAGPERARELMAAAVEECEAALDTASDPASRARISAELGHSHQQFAELLAGSPEGDASAGEALSRAERASAAFAAAGPDAVPFRAGAELAAGRLAAALGRPDRAAAHARAVLALHTGTDAGDHADGTAARHREEAAHLLRSAEEGTPEPSET